MFPGRWKFVPVHPWADSSLPQHSQIGKRIQSYSKIHWLLKCIFSSSRNYFKWYSVRLEVSFNQSVQTFQWRNFRHCGARIDSWWHWSIKNEHHLDSRNEDKVNQVISTGIYIRKCASSVKSLHRLPLPIHRGTQTLFRRLVKFSNFHNFIRLSYPEWGSFSKIWDRWHVWKRDELCLPC